MDFEFGHGFIPRIGEENYKAVDRCVGPTDLFSGRPLELPWAIADGAWAENRPELLDALRANGTRLIADTYGWRYRYAATQSVRKLTKASWATDGPVNLNDVEMLHGFFRSSLRAQAQLNVDAYLLPGWMPHDRTEDLRKVYEHGFGWASSLDDVPAKPFVQFVGAHSKGLKHTAALIEEIPHFVSAVYLQVSPIAPAKDSPAKVEGLLEICQIAENRGFQVIAGHCGSIAPALKAFGIGAADSGLATGETFNRSRAAQQRPQREKGKGSGGGRGARIYLSEIGLSLNSKQLDQLLEIPAAAAEIRGCRMPCHRFRAGNMIDWSREHSLYARVQDAQLVESLPASMRATAVYERLRKQRSTIATINGALESAGHGPLDLTRVDNQLAWVSRSLVARSAA